MTINKLFNHITMFTINSQSTQNTMTRSQSDPQLGTSDCISTNMSTCVEKTHIHAVQVFWVIWGSYVLWRAFTGGLFNERTCVVPRWWYSSMAPHWIEGEAGLRLDMSLHPHMFFSFDPKLQETEAIFEWYGVRREMAKEWWNKLTLVIFTGFFCTVLFRLHYVFLFCNCELSHKSSELRNSLFQYFCGEQHEQTRFFHHLEAKHAPSRLLLAWQNAAHQPFEPVDV